MRTVYTAAHLWDGARLRNDPMIVVEDGRIAYIGARTASELPPGTNMRNFPGAILAPAFFDVHIHGAAGHDVMEGTPQALRCVGRFLASRGTGAFLATTVSAPVDTTLKSIEGLAEIIAQSPVEGQARPIGIHLEGPFLSHGKRGAHPENRLLAPDIDLFDRMFEAAEGHVRLMDAGPGIAGRRRAGRPCDVARGAHLPGTLRGERSGHTSRHRGRGHQRHPHLQRHARSSITRTPGILETVLTDDELYAELICDGIHNMPELVRLWWRAKGPEKAILVTDAMSATGMPDGNTNWATSR